MSFWKRYKAYVKDNPERYWFKRKLFGWGWTPVTWQGWLVTLSVVVAILLNAFCRNLEAMTDREALTQIVAPSLLLAVLLIVICYKTGESPRWTWGFPKDKDNIGQ
ncbi:hypothetical protein KC722_02560 [Candidatus Kaiserbacteria bacterium]|nr:hypothetical protein [Candidatus Kaiserbacteria bacterium]MCB9811580.1 hypothetical protein [Candidatus Nomurabacteria bacterium]